MVRLHADDGLDGTCDDKTLQGRVVLEDELNAVVIPPSVAYSIRVIRTCMFKELDQNGSLTTNLEGRR